MKILITTFGTRGDIQPFIALGKGLTAAGHEVGLCTSEGYRASIEEYGLRYLHMDNDLLRLSQAALGEVSGIGDSMSVARQMMPALRRSMDDEWRAAQAFEPDAIVYHPKCLGSLHIADKLGIPAFMSLPLPFYTPTSEFPVPFMSGLALGGWFNRLSYGLMSLPSLMYRGLINDLRKKALGLRPLRGIPDLLTRGDGSPVPALYSYSAHLLPVPKDFPPHAHVTGYWFLDHQGDWQPEPGLMRFLESGAPPIYIGFGSMGARKGAERARIVLEALEKCDQRAILIRGWGGLTADSLPENVYMVESVPHDWLFPRVAAVVHHGGAGTTAAGLRAGKPSVICPFIADQPFWGKLVYERGVGPRPVPQRNLSAGTLAEAIATAVEDEAMGRCAAELGDLIRAEDGVGRAVDIIGAVSR
ncbi:MAG: glycosyltransferase family 1 protein [Anaerolineae bacterium]|nr:glycosyltransferase family 1 protein [Anaerolineae bacterium]